MEAQAWISIIVFIAAVIYSIVMASISPTFRSKWKLVDIWSFSFFFVSIIVAGLLISMSAQCSVSGKYGDYAICNLYSWILALLVLTLLGIFVAHGVMAHIEEKKDVNEVKRPTPDVTVEEESNSYSYTA